MNIQEIKSNHFALKGLTSILIGSYLLAGSFAIKYILDNYTSESLIFNVITPKNIHLSIFLIVILILVASILTVFISGKRSAKKLYLNLWSLETKKIAIGIMLVLAVLIFLFSKGFVDLITPVFLILYGFLLFIFRSQERKKLLIIASICMFLGVICFFIPSYWYSSFSILAIAHITYGFVSF